MKAGLRLDFPDKKIINIQKQQFYKNDDLNLQEYPDDTVKKIYNVNSKRTHTNQHINVTNLKNPAKQQIKDFLEILIFNYKDEIQKSFEEGKTTVADNMQLKVFRNKLVNLQLIIDFLEQSKNNDILKCDIEKTRTDFYEFIKNKKLYTKNLVPFIEQLYICLSLFYDDRNGLDKDIWILGQNLNIAEKRYNKTASTIMIDYTNITNETNKEMIKNYVKSKFELTDLSFTTIYKKAMNLKKFAIFLNELDLTKVTRKDILKYLEVIKDYQNSCNMVISIIEFYEWLSINEKINEIYIYSTDIVYKKHKKESSIDNFILRQIFNNLDKIPENIRLMFLISYSCGMRISEVCLLKKDLLYKDKNGYFIKYFSQKMQKEVTNPICESLYKMLEQYIKILPKTTNYLFNAVKKENYPCSTSYYRTNFNKAIYDLDIKDSNGNKYVFRAHDYRHTLATTMVELDIPVEIIQKVLHHTSPEMTLAYAEIKESHKIKKFKDFVNINGELAPLEKFKDIEDELISAEWIRQNINAQILPNGFCAMPIKLGKCPHANSCLECEDFRTSKEFLDQHKMQLKKTNELISICEQNNWLPQLQTNIHNKEILEKLINTLESEE